MTLWVNLIAQLRVQLRGHSQTILRRRRSVLQPQLLGSELGFWPLRMSPEGSASESLQGSIADLAEPHIPRPRPLPFTEHV